MKQKAKTAYGEVELKICEKNGIVYRYPEYESVKKLCEAAGVPFKLYIRQPVKQKSVNKQHGRRAVNEIKCRTGHQV